MLAIDGPPSSHDARFRSAMDEPYFFFAIKPTRTRERCIVPMEPN